jgi:hypothetical protein
MTKEIKKRILSIVLAGIIPLIILLFLLLSVFAGKKELILYPGNNILTGTFSDNNEGGNSANAMFHVTVERIIWTYVLKKGFITPYAGFTVKKDKFINLEPFDAFAITACSTNSDSIRVFMFTVIPGYTVVDDYNTYLHLQKEIPLCEEYHEYTVKFTELYTPEWWHEKGLSEHDPRLIRDLSMVHSLSVQSSINQPVDVTDTVRVKEIRFYRSSITPYSILIILFFIIYCGVLAFCVWRKKLLPASGNITVNRI